MIFNIANLNVGLEFGSSTPTRLPRRWLCRWITRICGFPSLDESHQIPTMLLLHWESLGKDPSAMCSHQLLPLPPQQKQQVSCVSVDFSLETISLSWIIQCEGHNERTWIFLILVDCDLSFQGFTYRKKAKSVFKNSRNTV